MDQSTAYIVLIVCGTLLGIILNLIILYWVIRAAVSGSLAKHRDELRAMLRAR